MHRIIGFGWIVKVEKHIPWGLKGGAAQEAAKVGGSWVFEKEVPSPGSRRNKVRTARPRNRETKLMRAQVSESWD